MHIRSYHPHIAFIASECTPKLQQLSVQQNREEISVKHTGQPGDQTCVLRMDSFMSKSSDGIIVVIKTGGFERTHGENSRHCQIREIGRAHV